MKKRKSLYNKEADKKWIEKNKEHKKHLSYRSTARSFIRNYANLEDIKELKNIIEIREEELN